MAKKRTDRKEAGTKRPRKTAAGKSASQNSSAKKARASRKVGRKARKASRRRSSAGMIRKAREVISRVALGAAEGAAVGGIKGALRVANEAAGLRDASQDDEASVSNSKDSPRQKRR